MSLECLISISCRRIKQSFLAGPPLVKMATGEESSDEELGGAKMHSNLSGVSDFLANDENEAIEMARSIVDNVIDDKIIDSFDDVNPPIYDNDEILGIIPENLKTPFDIRDLIVRFVDNSVFEEFKNNYGITMKCGWAKINNHKVGIIASNGVIFSESAKKQHNLYYLLIKIIYLFFSYTTLLVLWLEKDMSKWVY